MTPKNEQYSHYFYSVENWHPSVEEDNLGLLCLLLLNNRSLSIAWSSTFNFNCFKKEFGSPWSLGKPDGVHRGCIVLFLDPVCSRATIDEFPC
jgi:hypothetical protein